MTVLDELASQPHTAIEERLDARVRELWMERVALHFHDGYAGIPMTKFPEDLRLYEHLLWESSPSVVIEVGVHHGASALWFRDRLATLERYGRATQTRVIGIDIDIAAAERNLAGADPAWSQSIHLLHGDICDEDTVARALALVPDHARCLVVEDSAHEHVTTLASLRGLAHLIAPGGFFVVEDGCVDVEEMRLQPDWPRGVHRAIDEWLGSAAGSDFVSRRDLEIYGITCHPRGFLQRRRA
jgi:cephalosporin hydroxylase